jgi:hypothetical protein
MSGMKQPWRQKGAAPGDENAEAPPAEEPQQEPAATMEAKVASRGGTPQPAGTKKVGKWSLGQLRATDGICILQNGTNKFDSQKGMTSPGTIRNTSLKIKSDCLQEIPEEIARMSDLEVRLQSGTNKYDSQKGMVGFGTGRDVVRESHGVHKNPADLAELPEEKILLCEGIVRLQSGTNKYASQRGMTGFGTNRRETTKMVDTKHPDYNHEISIDQSIIRLQAGTNKFDSQKGMTGFGTNRRELTKMLDTKHPDQLIDHPDQSTIRYQAGSNKYASQVGMTGFGQPRWEVLQVPGLNRQVQIGQGLVPYQMGSNLYASQKGFVSFGTGRDVVRESAFEGDPIPFEETQKAATIIRSQAGWNKGDSQKGYTSFGSPRDVKGKHMKRLWELEFPEECLGHI